MKQIKTTFWKVGAQLYATFTLEQITMDLWVKLLKIKKSYELCLDMNRLYDGFRLKIDCNKKF